MDKKIVSLLAEKLNIKENSVCNVIKLTEEGGTVPFIARYRKEQTGSLNEEQLRLIIKEYQKLEDLEQRKDFIIKRISELGKLEDSLKNKILNSFDEKLIEDLYLPFKKKVKSRAQKAREKGLAPVASKISRERLSKEALDTLIKKILMENKNIHDSEEILQGAMDILAEEITENVLIRKIYREEVAGGSVLKTKVKSKFKDKETKYNNYYDYCEKLAKIPSHRLLAIRRANKEAVLSRKLEFDDSGFRYKAKRILNIQECYAAKFYQMAFDDALKRLLKPSLDKEVISFFEEKAETEAARIFQKNLHSVLLAAPAGEVKILGVDPGFKTGSKLALINKRGEFIKSVVIYPVAPFNKKRESEEILNTLIKGENIDIIAIGDKTASRENLEFFTAWQKKYSFNGKIIRVSEDGASVYSASKIAVKEFPDLDITVRGAISIARRVQDPLAELIKIDPKSLGVGQYQHDINSSLLDNSLSEVVESAVNKVGAEVNTASVHLLKYISGIGEKLAQNIVTYRNESGGIKKKTELLKVPLMGDKSFLLCAGFLRIKNAFNPLDNSAIHPESYFIAEKIAARNHLKIKDLIGNDALLDSLNASDYREYSGVETINDIIKELKKPARDPRKDFLFLEFSEGIREITDLSIGSRVTGVVTNVTAFGAFVDIGLKKDALIHISQISNNFVTDIHTVVSKGEFVKARVIALDVKSEKISLSLKEK